MTEPTPVRRTPAEMADLERSALVTRLLRDGVFYREDDERRWASLMVHQGRIRDYVSVLNLDFHIDEADGLAFLRGRPDAEADDDAPVITRLARRRELSFVASVLLVLLRKKLAEHEAGVSQEAAGGSRLVLTRDSIHELMSVFLTANPNQAKQADQIETHLGKLEDMGFVRKIKASGAPSYEVRRVLRHFVDAQWLAGFDDLLATYQGSLTGGAGGETGEDDEDGEG